MREAWGGTNSFEAVQTLTDEEWAQKQAADLNAMEGNENLYDGYDCPKCKNRTWLYVARGTTYTQTECECQIARRSIRRMMNSGLGNIIAKYTFPLYKAEDDWQITLKEAAMNFTKAEPGKWFFIGGASGAGKSHLCTAICRNLLTTKDVQYMMWEDECPELKGLVLDAEAYQNRMIRLKNVDVLYIDDFFSGKKERANEMAMPSFADVRLAREILNHRYVNGKTTIISSEWYSFEIYDIDAALGGRIIERAGSYALNIKREKEKNYRLKMGGGFI